MAKKKSTTVGKSDSNDANLDSDAFEVCEHCFLLKMNA